MPTPNAARGLRGLADRVEALGGRLRVWTPSRGRYSRQSGDPMRLAIAEDGVLLREGLSRLLERVRVRRRRASAATPRSCCARSGATRLDAVIVDIRLPPTHSDEGLRAALEIRAHHPARRGARPLAVRRGRAGDEAPGGLGRRRRLPPQGPDQRRSGLRRPQCGASRRAARRSIRSSSRRCSRGSGATIRSRA